MSETTTRTGLARELLAVQLPDGIGVCAGEEVFAGRGTLVELRDPARDELAAEWRDPGAEGAEIALELATEGFRKWTGLGPSGRADVLRATARVIESNSHELALLETATTGKPLRDTTAELRAVVRMFSFYAGWAERINGETLGVPDGWHAYTLLQPFGVVTAVTPWNAPILTAAANALPALAAGNAVIVKPSEFTPASTVRLARLFRTAGAPLGALTAAPGLGPTTGAVLTTDPRVGKIVFIGSVETGRAVAAAAATAGIPSVLELGGKSANVVFADADLEAAAAGALSAVFSGAGQSCQAGSRLLVQKSVHDELLDRMVTGVGRLRVGDPMDTSTEIGPIVHRAQYDRVTRLLEVGLERGARQLNDTALPRGITDHPFREGNWIMPVLLDRVTRDNPLEHTEIFGPVLCVDTFDDEAEAMARANGTRFGLAGAVWTGDVSRAHRFAAGAEAGTFYINCYKAGHPLAPFGGFKASGWGRASGRGVVEEFTQSKAVWLPTRPLAAPFPSLEGVLDPASAIDGGRG
ncbi:aldehyde dehydrogenase family protein [Streptosporangium saharense]|uniref:aldehyde dehydrogenase family protein n=1 Tax=Streptosporangium saharense TaxID=1706840 RepID=UPI00342D9A2F